MQYIWFPKKGAARSHSVKDRSPIDTFLEKASATAFPRKVCFFKLSMSALAVLTFVIKDKKKWRLCLLHRLCQTLGEIHVERIATDTRKLKEPVHWEYKISAFCSLLALIAKQVRVFWSSLLCSAATAVVRYLHLQGSVAKFLAQI